MERTKYGKERARDVSYARDNHDAFFCIALAKILVLFFGGEEERHSKSS